MSRPNWRWRWPIRVLAAFAVAWICSLTMFWFGATHVWYWSFALWAAMDVRNPRIGLPFRTSETIYVGAVLLPGALAGLYTYHRLTFRRYRDEHCRCAHCNYILKGLREPRCPECGESI